MAEIDTNKLNEKLLKFAEIFRVDIAKELREENPDVPLIYDGETIEYYHKDRKHYVGMDCDNTCPDLVNSLDAQYQYIWPKLRELGYMIRYQYSELRDNDTGVIISDWTYVCWIYDISRKHDRILRNHEFWSMNKDNPALACALAVEQLIEALER